MSATRDYPASLKRWFLAGLALFVLAILAEVAAHALFAPLPAWEETLLLDLEVIGLLVAFFSPFVFGVVLPLIE